MAERIRIFIADDSKDTREMIRQLISLSDRLECVGEAQSGMEALESLKTITTDVVLMDINMPGINGLETTERISRLYPNLIVIIMSVQGETEYLRKAMMSGAREYLIKPFNLDVLEETVQLTYSKEMERQQARSISVEQRDLEGKSKIITFFSTKGGVGKSVLALNTALALQQQSNSRTVLVDLDLQFGDLGILANLKPNKTISEAVEENALSDADILLNYVQPVGGIDMLLAPKTPEMAEYITEQHISTLLQTLKKMYRFIVLDVAVSFSEINLGALDASDKILMVSTMDILALKNTRLGIDVLRSLHHLDKVSLVVNRSGKGMDITVSDIEKALMIKPAGIVPDDEKILMDSINTGIPAGTDRRMKSGRFYKALEVLAQTLVKL